MSRRVWTVWLCAAVAAASVRPFASGGQQIIRSTAEGIVVGVSVTASGHPVRGLKTEAFVVRDNGIQQHPQMLAGTQPLDVSLWLDVSSSVAAPAELWQHAVAIAAELPQEDRIEVVEFFYGARRVVPWSPPPLASPSPLMPLQPSISFLPFNVTPVFDVVASALVRPGSGARRHVIAVLTDGAESHSLIAADELTTLAAQSDAQLFLVLADAVGPLAQIPANIRSRIRETLTRVTAATGGAIVPAKNAVSGFRDLLAQLNDQYVLGYTPTGVAAGGWHDIRVELKDPKGATVAARRGYFGG